MSGLKYEAAGVLGAGLLGALFLTTRFDVVGRESFEQFRKQGRPVIFVFWHGQLLPLIHCHRNEGVVVLVSEHGDGEYVTRVIERNGFDTVRGSSTRGGMKGLKGLVRAAHAGHDLALTPDGPRGPHGVFKPGALAAAQMTGAPIIPLAAGSSSGWHFRSWDAFLVPRPLARVSVEYLPPRFVPRDAERTDLEAIAKEVGRELNECTARLNPKGWFPQDRTPE
ncbi:MAG: lysophospholipid acyltransferase family protein [Gemmatimonadota bacterium]